MSSGPLGAFSQQVREAFAECNETRRLLTEWRDAREACLALAGSDMSKDAIATRNTAWGRLGNAEHALMTYARSNLKHNNARSSE